MHCMPTASVSRDKAGGAEIGCAEDFPACSISQISTFGLNMEGKVWFAHPVKQGSCSVQWEQLRSDAPKAKVTPELLTPKASYSQTQPSGVLRGPVTLGRVASLCSKNL